MIAVDTNVLARLLVPDAPDQTEVARRFIARHSSEDPLFVGVVVAVELAWLLGSRYQYPRSAVCSALNRLLMSANLVFEEEEAIKAAVHLAEERNADIADAIIAAFAERNGCAKTMTFDRNAAKRIPGMDLLA